MNTASKIPGPPNRWFGLNHLGAIGRDFTRFSHDLWRRYGDVVQYRVLGTRIFHFAHPEQIHELLVAKARAFHKPPNQKRVFGRFLGNVSFISDGEHWTRRRRLLGPLFQPHVIDAYRGAVLRQAETVFGALSPGETNIAHAMSDAALMSVAEALFGSSIRDAADDFRRHMAIQQAIVARQIKSVLPTPRWLPTRDNRALNESVPFFNSLVDRLIAQRRAEQVDQQAPRSDLLAALLDAVDAEDGSRLDDHEARGEALTMLAAGNDTTAAGLSWSAYLLAKYPETQERLYTEVQAALVDGRLAPQSAARLAYAEQVFEEAMRIYPPAPAIGRFSIADVDVGGVQIPRGSFAFADIFSVHRDPRWFDDPDEFRPERFSPEHADEFPAGAYLPFGLGPRACIGKRFAMMEGPLVLAELVRQWRFKLADTQGEPAMETQLSLHPQGGVRLYLEAREPAAAPTETIARSPSYPANKTPSAP